MQQPTVWERLCRKFPLDLSCGLHDLPKTRENVIILRVVRRGQPAMPRTYFGKNVSKNL